MTAACRQDNYLAVAHSFRISQPEDSSLLESRGKDLATFTDVLQAAFRAVLLLFNLLAEFQRAAGLPIYRQPATLRAQVLTCGSVLGRAGRRLVLHLSDSWGGLKTRIPLLDSILNWQIPTSPKLDPVVTT